MVDSRGQTLPPLEVPSDEKLRVMGDLLFLAFRSDRHRRMTTGTLRVWLEPPVEFGQFRVFRFDGVPRGMYTWAWLNRDTAAKMIRGEPLAPEDWRSGDDLWIVDVIAPYRGMAGGIAKFIMTPGNFTDHSFYFRRVAKQNQTRRIVNVSFRRSKLSKIYHDEDFLV